MGHATSFASGTSSEADSLGADIGHIADNAAGAARTGVAELKEGAQHALKTAKEALSGAKDVAKETYEGAKKVACEATDSLKQVVSRNPVASISIAAGVGVLLALVLFRPRS